MDKLDTILEATLTGMTAAMRAAVYGGIDLDSVPDDPAAAVRARGRQGLNCTFERIEGMGLAPNQNLKGFVVIVPACFANWHKLSSVKHGSEVSGETRVPNWHQENGKVRGTCV